MPSRLTIFALSLVIFPTSFVRGEEGLIAHWPLNGDARDISGNQLDAIPHGIEFTAGRKQNSQSARFDGREGWLEAPQDGRLQFGDEDFSISVWANLAEEADDVPGDIISRYDPRKNRGFHFGVKSNAGVTFSQSNWRQVQFGVDQDRGKKEWRDEGRPGNAVLAFALCAFDGALYAGTCEPGMNESGHVYRFARSGEWVDCGSPDDSNAVVSLVEFGGKLYAGTGKYRLRGSSLPESKNPNLGGSIFRYAGGKEWVACGQLPECEAVGGLVVFRNRLYASSLYRPAGFYRYDGGTQWSNLDAPSRPQDSPGDGSKMRVEALGVYNGSLYATSYDGGRVFRFDGAEWEDCGRLGENTQTYSFAVRAGRLYVGTWPSGRVYRMEAPLRWTDVGRLGEELEVMGMLVHNGRLIAGTLPLAEVYQYDGVATWRRLTRLDHTPDVRYRRAWTMAEFDGHVFCSTLPSGKIYSWRAGQLAMSRVSLRSGWRHLAAVRAGRVLKVYIDGELVGESSNLADAKFDLNVDQPLKIGSGPNDFFCGRLADVRVYSRALSTVEIRKLGKD